MEREPGTDLNHTHCSKEERLSALFDSCYPRLARYAYARTGDRTEAEDIASEVFLRALQSLDTYRERGLPMEGWLFRIAHNLVVDRLRRMGRFERADEDEAGLQDSTDPARVAEERILIASVKDAMTHLTQEQRDVLSLRFFAGLSSKETGAALDKSDGAVREMQRTALQKLKGLLA